MTLLVALVIAVPLAVSGAGFASFLLLRADFGLLVWAFVPLAGLLLVVGALGVALGRAAGESGTNKRIGMVYSPEPMDGRDRQQEIEDLEAKIGELDRITDSLDEVSDEELIGALDRAVELVGEINAGIEAGLHSAGGELREVGTLLGQVDFGSFDSALEEAEERGPDDRES